MQDPPSLVSLLAHFFVTTPLARDLAAVVVAVALLGVLERARARLVVALAGEGVGLDDGAAAAVLFRVLVGDEQLAVLAVAPRLLLRHLDRVPDRRRLVEDGVHLLERAVRRLRVQEVDDGHDEAVAATGLAKWYLKVGKEQASLHDGEDDVGLPGDGGEGDGRDHDDHEVEGPVGARGQRVGGRADAQRYDLGRVQPGHAEPADGEEGVEDEQEHGRHDTRAGAADVFQRGPVDDGQDHHGDGHAGRTEQHELPAAELLDGEDGDPRGGEVLGAVEGGQQARHERRQADLVLVDVGRVVGDQVDARDLLEDLVDVGQHGAVEVAVLGHGEEVAEAALGHLGHDVLDGDELVLDELVVGREAAERAEHVHRLVFVALEDEPARRLGQLHDAGDDDEGEEDLEGNGEAPRHGAGLGVVEAKVDPVADANTAGDEGALDHDKHAASVGLGALGLPCRDRGRVETVAETVIALARCSRDGGRQSSDSPRDETRSNEHGQVDRRRHERGTDDHNGRADEDGAAAAELVAEPDGGDGAEEAADVVSSNGDTLRGGTVVPLVLGLDAGLLLALLGGVDLGELGDEGRQREQTAHDTLIVTEQQEVETGHEADGQLQLIALQAEITFASEHDGGVDRTGRVRQREWRASPALSRMATQTDGAPLLEPARQRENEVRWERRRKGRAGRG